MDFTWLGELIVIIWFFFHWPIILFAAYWYFFREWPFPKGYKWSSDLKMIRGFRKQAFKNLYTDNSYGSMKHEEGDYYDDYDGFGSNTGPRVRHPKNRDRAYSGGSERFDDGGW